MIRFGPAGNDITFYNEGNSKTIEAPKWLRSKGLNAFEYSFGRGINLSDLAAQEIGQEFRKYDIQLSVHAPYYINFASVDEEAAEKSYNYVLTSLKKLRILGGNRIVVHVGSCGKLDRQEAIRLTKERLIILKNKLIENGFEDMLICLETMGKKAQIGSYQEIVELCKIYKNYVPALDFGHINSFTNGGIKTKADYAKILDCIKENLDDFRSRCFHVHFSKIEYGDKGEIRHLTLEDTKYGPDFLPFAELLKERKLEPVIICESKEYMARDAVILKQIYDGVKVKTSE